MHKIERAFPPCVFHEPVGYAPQFDFQLTDCSRPPPASEEKVSLPLENGDNVLVAAYHPETC